MSRALRHPNNARGGSHTETVLGVSYNTAFRVLGPTPRKVRVEPKKGGKCKFPDEAVREVRRLSVHLTDRLIALELAVRWPGITGEWVRAVRDGTIRASVK